MSPFTSQAQRGYMYKFHPKIAAGFEEKTPHGKKLPYHVKKTQAAKKAMSNY